MAVVYLYPGSIAFNDANWSVTGGGTLATAVDDPYYAANDSDFDVWGSGVADGEVRFTLSSVPMVASITNVTMNARCKRSTAGDGLKFAYRQSGAGASNYGPVLTLGASFAAFSWSNNTNPSTSAAWTVADVKNGSFGMKTNVVTTSGEAFSQFYVAVTCTLVPLQIAQTRDAGSRRVAHYLRPRQRVTIAVPVDRGLDVEVGSIVQLSHFDLPSSDGTGALYKRWQRREFMVMKRTPDPLAGVCALDLEAVRGRRFLFWDAAYSSKSPGITEDGVIRCGNGQTTSYTRNSNIYERDPETLLVTSAPADTRLVGTSGEELASARTNYLIHSSFDSGTTGWTVSSGSATADSTDNIFDTSLNSSGSLKLDTAAGTAVIVRQTTGDISGLGNTVTVSIEHKDDSGSALSVRVQRTDTGAYWRDSDRTWQVGVTNNTFTVRSSAFRDSLQIDATAGGAGAFAAACTLTVSCVTVATAAKIYHLYHGQVEFGAMGYTSRIFTQGSTASRIVSAYTISNNSGVRSLSAAQGSLFMNITPGWTSASMGSANKTLVYLSHDANNSFWLYYDGSVGAFKLAIKAAGSTTTTTYTQAVTAGTEYGIGARWTGSEGELDLTSYTQDLFVNGTKGTAAVGGAAMTEVASANIEMGAKAAAEYLDAYFRDFFVTNVVYTNTEMARFPTRY